MTNDRLERQLAFLLEIDRLKAVFRRTTLADGSRPENSAEHSWHMAVYALVLAEQAAVQDMDLLKAVKMMLIHDVVEVDAGDTFCYSGADPAAKARREERAAERLFGLLPPDQAEEFAGLWREFEARKSPEALFAAALDRFQAFMNNYRSGGAIWRDNRVGRAQVEERNAPMGQGAPMLWEHARALLDEAERQGLLPGPDKA